MNLHGLKSCQEPEGAARKACHDGYLALIEARVYYAKKMGGYTPVASDRWQTHPPGDAVQGR